MFLTGGIVLKKKASQENIVSNEKKGFFSRFCSAQEKKARISLIIAAAVVIATVGSVCAAAIKFSSGAAVPSENIELNAAEQYLSQAVETSGTVPTDPSTAVSSAARPTEEPKTAKRGHLTGEHVVDVGNLKSMSDEELVDAIVSGKAGVIDTEDIETDQSQNENNVHHGEGGDAPAPTDTPTPVPTNVPTPTMAPVTVLNYELGIDISEFQGDINWSAVRDDGITFAFIRCGGRGWGSSGKIYEDTKFFENVRKAQAAGIKVGAYFFSQALTPYEALEEASMTLSKVNSVSLDLPVVLDWETGSGYRTEDIYGQDFANVITAFCSTIAQNGYTPCVYLNTSDINNRLGSYSGDILSRYKLWYAYPYACYSDGSFYQTGDTIPPRSFSFEYWQYSWHGDVSGISTDCDLNIRILGNTTLIAPEINLENETITSAVGEQVDLLEGVSATTSQDYTVTSGITYTVKDSEGKTISEETARNTAGTYTVIYEYDDSFRGEVTATATWVVTDALSPTPSISVTPTPTPDGGNGDTPTPTPEGGGEDTPTPTPDEGGNEDTPTPAPEPEPDNTEETPETSDTVFDSRGNDE